ncbi:MAG TPA: type III-A CRISPR-associated protein Csm2 [Bryobacteraceae bacterium]|nr:type III-A CRISPR-associated protein Csm2 [Bryobacteraceae bacterium]
MDDAVENQVQDEAPQEPAAPAVTAEASAPEAEKPRPEAEAPKPRPEGKPQGQKREEKPREEKPREDRRPQQNERRGDRPGGGGRGEHRPEHRGGPREGGRPGGPRPFEGFADIELEKLISDSLYLDNQAHAVVARMRDMDSGTKSQLRRLYNAVRRAVRAPESERQHQFVMLRARLAYTIARHSLRSLDALERLLLQVTRKNDARGYERFKDLFEAIVAYNE